GWLHLLSVLMLALGLAGIKFYGSWWPMALLLCAAAIRMGTFPFQGWLKPSASTTDGPQTALLAGPFMSSGIYLFCAIGTSAQAAPELHRAVPGALLLALCYSPLAALAQLSVLSSIGFISAALCAFFALTASVLGTQAAISAALLGTAAQGLAASLSALSYSRRQTAKPLFTPLALAGAPATILFAAFFVAVSLLFRKNIYLAGAALLALLLSAAAAHALNDKNSPYTGEKPAGALAELSLKLIALAIIAGGLFPFLQGAHPPF
ncbi:MAG TPA: hypothetical protein PLL10_10200, partial [Elusimicrobiales bacterium]|nr:hypothetical protein [Elusimicrobiales bacterium]